MILIALGANLPNLDNGPPRQTCGCGLAEIDARGILIVKRSRWYQSAPVPVSDAPWYVNGIAQVDTDLAPDQLLATLLEIELKFGRQRSYTNAPRTLDLDLICYNNQILDQQKGPHSAVDLILPHPRLSERAFVLMPLSEVAPHWSHPRTGKSIDHLIKDLPQDQQIEVMQDATGEYGTEFRR